MKKNNTNPMSSVLATTRKTVAYASAFPETFRPRTKSYAWYEQMSGICTAGLDHFTDMESARPLLEIMELFAQTDRPEAKALYGAYLNQSDKPWYNPLVGKIMLMHAIDEVKEDNPQAPYVMFVYAMHVLTGKGWFHRDEKLAGKWLKRSAELGCVEAGVMLRAMERKRV